MNLDAIIWPILFGLALGSPCVYFIWRFYRLGHERALAEIGIYQVNDFFIEKVRHAIIADVSRLKLGGLTEADATDLVFETTRHSIAKTFSEVYTGNKFKVTNDWPYATVVIVGNIAVVKPWLGHDQTDKGEGVKAINVEIDRAPALKLSTRDTIKSVFEQTHPLPNNRTDEPRKVASLSAKPSANGEGAAQKTEAKQPTKEVPSRRRT